MKKIAVIDNYDSFTYNLVHYIEKCGVSTAVYYNNQISTACLEPFDKICISPGPGLPQESGITMDVIKKYAGKKNILGVCLGLQAIVEVYGGKLKNLKSVLHGCSRETIVMEADVLFENIPKRFYAGRYHSWVADKNYLPAELEIIAKDDDGEIMAIRHKKYLMRAVQFHPESILTPYGQQIISNWVKS